METGRNGEEDERVNKGGSCRKLENSISYGSLNGELAAGKLTLPSPLTHTLVGYMHILHSIS